MAFLCGVASADREVRLGLPLALFALSLAVVVRKRGRGAILGVAVAAAAALGGAWRADCAFRGAERRIDAWLPRDGAAIETSFVGRVVASAEPAGFGEAYLRVRGEPNGARGEGAATISVRVPARAPGISPISALRRGDEIRIWCRLRRPYPAGNPGVRDPRRGLLARGIDATGTVKSTVLVEPLRGGAPGLSRALDSLRAACRRRLDRALGCEGTARAVAGAMLLGDQGAIEGVTWRRLRDGGLVHVVSISGLHVALLAGAVLGAMRRMGLGERGTFLVALPLLGSIVALAGGDPPVLRAALTSALCALGRAAGRRGEPIQALAVSALLLVALRPFYLADIGFQLSHAATAGLVGLGPVVARRIPVPRSLGIALGASAGAYVATSPLAAWHFGRLAPAALVANVAAAALCALVLAAATLAAAVASMPTVGPLAAALAEAAVSTLLDAADLASGIPGGALRVPFPGAISVAACSLLVAAAIGVPRSRRRRGAVALGLALAVLWIHVGPPPDPADGEIRADVLDVGQGLAVVLRGPQGRFLVVDCGGTAGGRFDAGERIVVPWLSRIRCRRLSALVLSHGHDDHAGGAESLIREVEIGALWVPLGGGRDPAIRRAVDEARRAGAAVVGVATGQTEVVAGIPLEVLFPERGPDSGAGNERCLVLRAGRAPARLLLPADLEGAAESSLEASGLALRSEALVVGHHGSARASSGAFLDAVGPSLAVISVGARNRFGHPSPEVLDRLRSRGIPVYRTDRNGLVRLRGSPEGFEAEVTSGSVPE